ncbi:hydrolase [Mucilaginibacter gilvus]|uniref:Hydrolase n=1 Tax=Mucilaginibacter gilvus TaxID=2305909 RepID=A0A444MI29_9SPHI|nr:hydrolase [Mucilaginibacter gilvus]RWY47359.1 hydrolase [Mucilaginibacter gilvus]
METRLKNQLSQIYRIPAKLGISLCILLSTTAAIAQNNVKTGLDALLTPENCVVILIDHQPFQFANIGSHNTQLIMSNVINVAKVAKVFKIPTLLTTVVQERGGYIMKQLQDVFPDQKPIDRTFINAWQDPRVVEWVKKSGKKKIVIAALWTEVCLAMPTIQAMGEGYEVYIITDASGGTTLEAHDMAVLRMVQAGAIPITTDVWGAELQRDWARHETARQLGPIALETQGALGIGLSWENQLLNSANKK